MKNIFKNIKIKIKELFELKQEQAWELAEHITYDAFYEAICPVCKTKIEADEHGIEDYKKRAPYFAQSIVMECSNCHLAVYGKQTKIVKTKKTYKHYNAIRLPDLISEEVIND